jgi:hypothetical protein
MESAIPKVTESQEQIRSAGQEHTPRRKDTDANLPSIKRVLPGDSLVFRGSNEIFSKRSDEVIEDPLAEGTDSSEGWIVGTDYECVAGLAEKLVVEGYD